MSRDTSVQNVQELYRQLSDVDKVKIQCYLDILSKAVESLIFGASLAGADVKKQGGNKT